MSVYNPDAFSYLPRPYWLYTVVILDGAGWVETWTQYAWAEDSGGRTPEEAHASVSSNPGTRLMSKQRII